MQTAPVFRGGFAMCPIRARLLRLFQCLDLPGMHFKKLMVQVQFLLHTVHEIRVREGF